MSVNIGSRGCSSGKTRVENDDFVAIELEVVVVVVIVVVPLAIHQNVFSSSSSSVSLTIIVPVVFLKQTFKYYHFLFYFVIICNNNFFFTTTFLRRRGLKNSKMDFVSSLYETFSGQTLGRPNKKTKKKKTPQKKSSSQLVKKSLKSPQNAKVKKKASSKTPRASPLLTKVPRPNLKSITNKPLPPPSKKEKSNETSDARTTTTTRRRRETKKNAAYDVSTIQSALAKGEDLRPVMQKIETKKRAILGEIDALERETKRKKKEVVELEKALLLGANRW